MIEVNAYKMKWAIIRPVESGRIITKKDKREFNIETSEKHYACKLFRGDLEEVYVKALKLSKLSKKMIVTIITDAQFGLNGKKPATIDGTPFYATKKQLAESFIIG